MKKAATKSEKAHMELVKQLLCVVCHEDWYDETIALGVRFSGGKQNLSEYDHLVDGYRLGHMFGNPLCKPHHDGKKGYGDPVYHWDSSKPNQWKYLEKVYKVLGKEIPEYKTKGRNNFKDVD